MKKRTQLANRARRGGSSPGIRTGDEFNQKVPTDLANSKALKSWAKAQAMNVAIVQGRTSRNTRRKVLRAIYVRVSSALPKPARRRGFRAHTYPDSTKKIATSRWPRPKKHKTKYLTPLSCAGQHFSGANANRQ